MGYLAKTGRINSLNLKKALGFGTVAASFNVEDFGLNRTSKLKPRDLQRRMVKFRECFNFNL